MVKAVIRNKVICLICPIFPDLVLEGAAATSLTGIGIFWTDKGSVYFISEEYNHCDSDAYNCYFLPHRLIFILFLIVVIWTSLKIIKIILR